MDSNNFNRTLNALLEVKDCKQLLKILIAIRREVDWPKHKNNITVVQGKGCLKQIVSSLQSPQKYVVNVALSILGNLCMDRNCTREIVGQHHILSPLNHILKKYGKEDSINGRVFRIIGNMCQHRDMWANIILDRKPQVITYIVDFLKRVAHDEIDKISEATVVMGIRALRELLNGHTLISLVKNYGVLKVIGMLLIKYSQKWTVNKEYQDALYNIIKLLQQYSKYRYYPSILEMRNTGIGDSLVYLGSILLVSPRRIVKLVMNFIKISQLQSDLPIPEICEGFINVLKNSSLVEKLNDQCLEYIRCLCYLLEHPINRNTSRCKEIIPLLIKLLDDFQYPSNEVLECCILIIATLNKCKYNMNLIADQLNCNIISVLVKKMEWICETSKNLNIKHKTQEWKRKRNFDEADNIKKKRKALEIQDLHSSKFRISNDEEMDFSSSRYDCSPNSPSSGSESGLSPAWPSPCSSPLLHFEDLDGSDSDDYSPVCSESDHLDFPNDHDEEMEKCDVELLDEDDSTDIVFGTISSLKLKLLSEIGRLLKVYINVKPTTPYLLSENLFRALINCSGHVDLTYSRYVDSVDIICNIIGIHILIPIMQTDIIEMINSLKNKQHGSACMKCIHFESIGTTVLDKISSVAGSEVGKGEIANKLLLGELYVKKNLAIRIPFIINDPVILESLMLKCGGLEILTNLLLENTELTRKGIKALCKMAIDKSMKNPRLEKLENRKIRNRKTRGDRRNKLSPKLEKEESIEDQIEPKIIRDDYKLRNSCSNSVTFRLDDGTLLEADRAFLSEKSDYFQGLLNGSFKESREDIVDLHNTDSKALRYLIHILQCDIPRIRAVDLQMDLPTLLDVILLSDRYLMMDLSGFVADWIQQHRISAETVPAIYKWSVESNTNLLRIESVAFALVDDLGDSDRFRMFEGLLSLGYSVELVDDIQTLLRRYLHEHDYDISFKETTDELGNACSEYSDSEMYEESC